MIVGASTARTVFISYSRRDQDYLERLQEHLKPHVRAGTIPLWVDTQIEPGNDWHQEIEQALSSMQVAILLVSVSFLASDFVDKEELPRLLAAAEERGVHILPVLVTPCSFRYTKLSRFHAVNDLDRPLSMIPLAEQDVVWEKVVDRVLKILEAGPNPAPPRMRSQVGRTPDTLFITLTRLTMIVHRLNIILGTLALLTVIVAIVLGRVAPDQLEFTNVLGYIAYYTSIGVWGLELYVLAVYRQWIWLVCLLVVGAVVYLSNIFFVFGSLFYVVATSVPLMFIFGRFYTSRRTKSTAF